MSLTLLFTGLSLLAVAACVFYANLARESARKAEHSEHRLAIQRGQVAGLEASLMGLDAKFQKLAGRVYADQYWRGKREEQPELEPTRPDGTSRDICPNWSLAQKEGPSSPAAQCTCDYCESRRAERAERRAKLRAGVKP